MPAAKAASIALLRKGAMNGRAVSDVIRGNAFHAIGAIGRITAEVATSGRLLLMGRAQRATRRERLAASRSAQERACDSAISRRPFARRDDEAAICIGRGFEGQQIPASSSRALASALLPSRSP